MDIPIYPLTRLATARADHAPRIGYRISLLSLPDWTIVGQSDVLRVEVGE
jgi:hypothetical protein